MIQRASKKPAMKLKIFFCCTFYEEIGTIIKDFIMKIAEMDKLRYTIHVTSESICGVNMLDETQISC